MNKSLATLFSLLTFYCSQSFAFWQTCDEQWKEAWSACDEARGGRCFSLNDALKPSCKPEDKSLTEKRQFIDSALYETLKRLMKEEDERKKKQQKTIIIHGFSYSSVNKSDELTGLSEFGNPYLRSSNDDSIRMTVDLTNKNKSLLERVAFTCEYNINNTYRLFKGDAYAFPNLIGGARAKVDLYFLPENYPYKNNNYNYQETHRYLETKGVKVDSLEGGCQFKRLNLEED